MHMIEVEKMIAEATKNLEVENAKLREELAAAQKDTARLDLFEANPTWLRYHKNTGRPVITYVGGKGEMK